MSDAILLFVKYPTPGKVKTRLAATVGHERAAEIYRRLVAHVCGVLPRDAVPVVLYDPPERRSEIESWLGPMLADAAVFEPQCPGDLGARLRDAFDRALSVHDRVAAIGTDCIGIGEGTFARTWAALDHADCVVGPASDGGYYLLALSRRCPELFVGIPWSAPDTLEKTMERACGAGLSVHLLPELHDVDTESDWKRAEARLRSGD